MLASLTCPWIPGANTPVETIEKLTSPSSAHVYSPGVRPELRAFRSGGRGPGRADAGRSQSGRIIRNTLTDGPVSEIWSYTFDDAGRLTQAVLDDGNPTTVAEHVLTHEFASSNVCGAAGAGKNGNRTGFTDVKDGVTVADINYCYDWADRLTGSSAGPVGR